MRWLTQWLGLGLLVGCAAAPMQARESTRGQRSRPVEDCQVILRQDGKEIGTAWVHVRGGGSVSEYSPNVNDAARGFLAYADATVTANASGEPTIELARTPLEVCNPGE